jgi:hypothetical protein
MARAPESEATEPTPERPRRWYHPRKTDLAFVGGLVVFMVNGLRGGRVDPTIVYGSVALMGFAAAGRVDGFFGGDGGRR